jgi:hypothetical protein
MAKWRQHASSQDISSSFCRIERWMSDKIWVVRAVVNPCD